MTIPDDSLNLEAFFTEPPRPPTPEPTTAIYTRDVVKIKAPEDWREIKIRLVGSHPLWGNHLWNAALALATYLDSNSELYQNRYVLELGAGGALPSIIAAKNGASKVVATDYPDVALVDNIRFNISENGVQDATRVDVQGYIWGRPVEPLLSLLPPSSPPKKFDLVILSDLIFNHSQHDSLIKTCDLVLTPNRPDLPNDPCVLVFYTHHRPHLAHKDMEFFARARASGWTCEEILTNTFPPMFPEDSGEESIRSTVHGWKLTK